MTPTEKVLALLPDAKAVTGGWQARCRAHDDRTPSLSISAGEDGRALVHCHAGCTQQAVIEALGLKAADLMPPTTGPRREVAAYPYRDEHGTHLFDVVRFEPKGFAQRRADGTWGLKGVRRVPYRLKELKGPSVFVVEGEKDADTLAKIGLQVTCNPGGAEKWISDYSTILAQRGITRLCILPDNDDPGRRHAEQVAAASHAAGIEARILALPDLPDKGDVSDWLRAGGTKAALSKLAKAAPIWTPATPQTVTATDTGVRTVTLTRASAIAVRPVRWLWADRMPLGSLGLIGGREGIGKTTCAYTLAGEVTRGTLPGVFSGQPRAVGIAATEDSWSHTIVPRLMAAGADLDLVYRIDVHTASGVDSTLTLPRDLDALGRLARSVDMALLILDPLLSRLDSSLNTHVDAEVRVALEPLTKLADENGLCVLGLIHVNKSTSSDPLTMLMASRAFAAVARFVLFVMADPDTDGLRLLGQPKNNLGRTDLPTLAFNISGACVAQTDEGPVWTTRLHWLGETDRTIDDAITSASNPGTDPGATSEATDWLQDYLASQGGAAESKLAKDEGRKAGHSEDAIKRASKRLRVKVISAGFPRRTSWKLSPQSAQGDGESVVTALTTPTEDNPKESADHSRSTVGAISAVGAVSRVCTDSAPTGYTREGGIDAERL